MEGMEGASIVFGLTLAAWAFYGFVLCRLVGHRPYRDTPDVCRRCFKQGLLDG